MKADIPPFTTGQKVICVFGGRTHDGKNKIDKGSIYTVVSCFFDTKVYLNSPSEAGVWIIRLSECGGGYPSQSFRPIQEQPMKSLTFEKIKETEREEILIMN